MVEPAHPIPTTQLRSRRALLAGALGGIGALAATVIGGASRAQAASGDPLILGSTTNGAGTANTSLTTSSTGTALLVTQNGSGTALRGSAVGPGSIAGFFTAQNGTGVSGVTGNPASYGVYGGNDGAAGTGAAVRAAGGSNIGLVATSDGNIGVVGTSNSYIGVAGNSTSSLGVRGISTNGSGVLGISGSSSGVAGQSTSGYGVYGASTSSYAGWFDGPLYASSASASIKSFRIDHPLDPANQVLMHSCVESNERKLVYDGVVTTDAKGEASIELPAWFGALNADLRYQLTPIGDARAWISATVKSNRFSLKTDQPQTEVCWQVTGIRQDAYSKAHPLVVEAAKTGKEKGKYFNPIEHGQPASAGVDYEMQLKAKAVHP